MRGWRPTAVVLALAVGAAALAAPRLLAQDSGAPAAAETTPAPDTADTTSPAPGASITAPLGVPEKAARIAAPVLTIDQDRLFNTSLYGKRVASEIEEASRDLAAENRKIEAELTAEERDLTDRRASLPPDEFRKLADAFDAKVEGIRHSQDAKTQELSHRTDTERRRFFRVALPVLSQLMRDSGAVAILNAQAIFLSFREIDVTDAAVARIDAAFGDGSKLPPDNPPGNAPDNPDTSGK